jgi:multiple antibiotic resistance protein
MKDFLSAFIPLFVAVDVIGLLPIFVTLTHGLNEKKRTRIVVESIVTAFCLTAGFIFLGKAVFRFLNITMGDFLVAGGALLFVIAILDIINTSKEKRPAYSEPGAVPIGTPLIAGPAVLATSLLMQGEYGVGVTFLAVLANMALAGLVLYFSGALMKIFGNTGSRAMSKVVSILLAAIAVMMVRKGIYGIVAGGA